MSTNILDLTKEDANCGTNSPSARIMTRWVQMGKGELEVIAQRGVQSDQVEMWIEAFKDSGVKLKERKEIDGNFVYTIELPESL